MVFTDPQVAWVGPTAAEARAAGQSVETRDAAYTPASGAALLRDDADGKARLVVESGPGRLLGATFVGPDVAELLHSATVAITGGLDLETLGHAVPATPRRARSGCGCSRPSRRPRSGSERVGAGSTATRSGCG